MGVCKFSQKSNSQADSIKRGKMLQILKSEAKYLKPAIL